MSAFGIVLDFSHYVATIHHQNCRYYRAAVRKHLPLPDRTKVRLCRVCRPEPEDIAVDPPEVRWFEYGPGVIKRAAMDFDVAMKLATERSLGIRKRHTTNREFGA